MHKDVAKALEAAVEGVRNAKFFACTDEEMARTVLTRFHRSLPNSTDTANGLALWYPTRILVELTEESPTE